MSYAKPSPDIEDVELDFALKFPTPSSIYRRGTFEETLSAMIDANGSRPARKRLPMEILLLVNKELHATDPVYEEIRSTWEPVGFSGYFFSDYLNDILLDKEQNTFYISKVRFYKLSDRSNIFRLADSFSAADLLYRVRCFFPEIPVFSQGRNGDKWVWRAIRHKRTGISLLLSERGGAVQEFREQARNNIDYTEEDLKEFNAGVVRLHNALFETVDGTRYAYFHPAAYADVPTASARFLAVPGIVRDRLNIRGIPKPYLPWHPVALSLAELSSSKSILQDLKYNVGSREVDAVKGTEDLTTIISSSLLFYRLLCYYVWTYGNVNDTPPITSVWQIKLEHEETGASVIFMDDHGLFDIRAGEDAKEVMNDLVALVTALCSDHECSHPYGDVVAGCVA